MTVRLAAALLLLAGVCYSQNAASDTARAVSPDSILPVDTTRADSIPPDTTHAPATDSLSQAERARLEFEKRRQKYQQEQATKERIPPLSLFDTLVVYFTSPRMNVKGLVDQSFFHDASDYFRLDPSYFTLTYQSTPMRSTVQPFGLSGDRLGFVSYGYRLNPAGHTPEPQGLVEMDAIPTALDNEIFTVPGPSGQIFGSRSGVASLVTRPLRPNDYDVRSAFLADQGGFEYAFVRGRLTKRFTDGRTVDASVEYRNGDGQVFGENSDQYNYYGDLFFPLGKSFGLHTMGYLYDLNGPLLYRPDLGGSGVYRDQFNRQAQVSFTHDAEDGTRRFEFGYRHERHGTYNTSFSSGGFKNRLNWTSHGAFVSREWVAGRTGVSVQFDGDRLEYDTGYDNFDRIRAGGTFRLADLSAGWRYAITAGGEYVEDFPFLPSGSLTLLRDGEAGMVMLSGGYVSRAPHMNELYLPAEQGTLYGGSNGYGEVGNPDLDPERQMTGSVTVELGSQRSNVNLSATGGRIQDGIEWQPVQVSSSLLRFSPINTDIDFASVTVAPRIALGSFLSWRGGGSYHWIDYDQIESPAYSPEYQAFTSLELHVYWKQKGIDLFAYGELVYTGEYHGYVETEMGETVIPNGKLSFAMGPSFRMNFVFQNVFSTEYRQREYYLFPGRYFFFGFEWRFLN